VIRRTDHLSGTTLALACLALGHDDADEPDCLASTEDIVRQLVEEVQRLRVAAGIVEETAADRAEAVGAVDDALTVSADAFVTGPELAQVILDHLADNGWALRPALPR
jgi:hypothetical protein